MDTISIERNGSSNDYQIMLTSVALNVRSYMASKYNEDFSEVTDEGVVLSAMALVPFEDNVGSGGGTFEERNTSYSAVFDCLVEAIGIATGIYGLVSSFINLWNSGASISSVIGFAKNIFKTSLGWFMVGWGVYKFGDCIGWW